MAEQVPSKRSLVEIVIVSEEEVRTTPHLSPNCIDVYALHKGIV